MSRSLTSRSALARPIAWALRVSALLLLASVCARCVSSESHLGKTKTMLAECSVEAPCADELSCFCFCTVTCENDAAPCQAELERLGLEIEPSRIACRSPSCEGPGDDQNADVTGICDVSCASDGDCAVFSDSHRCLGGFCRQELVSTNPNQTRCPEDMALVPGDGLGTPEDVCLDRYEVTVFGYESCVAEAACSLPGPGNYFVADAGDQPIQQLSDVQAAEYCAFLGRRLPTRREWQWAAQNGEAGTAYPWGEETPSELDSPPRACAFAQERSCSIGAHPAGDSALGVSDLAGNVSELVDDEGTPCAAGGSYRATDAAELSSSTCRPYVGPADDVGLRCAASP